MSKYDDVNTELRYFGACVESINEIHKVITLNQKSASLANIGKYIKVLSDSANYKPFIDELEIYASDDVKTYKVVVDKLKSIATVKWKTAMELMNSTWSSSTALVCTTTPTSQGAYVMQGKFSAKKGGSSTSDSIRNIVESLRKLDIAPNLCKGLDLDENGFCSSLTNNRGNQNTWPNYLARNNVSFDEVRNDAANVLKMFRFVRDTDPFKILSMWGETLVFDKTVGDLVTSLVENEQDANGLNGQHLPNNMDGIRAAFSKDDAVAKLIDKSRANESTQRVASVVADILKTSPTNKTTEALQADLDTSTKKLVDVADSLAYAAPNDAVRILLDLHARMIAVSKVMTKFSRSGSALNNTWSAGNNWTSATTGLIQPLLMPKMQGETRPQVQRMTMYVAMVQQQISRVDVDPLLADVDVAKKNAIAILTDLVGSTADPECNIMRTRQMMIVALKTYIKNVKRVVARYAQKHSDFVMWSNRRALEYMLKWVSVPADAMQAKKDDNGNSVPVVDADTKKILDEYFVLLSKLAGRVGDTMGKATQASLSIFTSSSGSDYIAILNRDETMLEIAQKAVDGLEASLVATQAKLIRMYSPAGYSALDILKDPAFIALYIVKSFRVLLLWISLVFAKGFFMPLYNDSVYVRNVNPPNAMWFVLIFLAIDLGLNVAMYVLLMTLKFIFKTKDNIFPIDDHVMFAVLVDYGISTLMIASLSLIVASVIQRKKYFRYRYEGERGVRALTEMLFWIDSTILFIPFFRFLDV